MGLFRRRERTVCIHPLMDGNAISAGLSDGRCVWRAEDGTWSGGYLTSDGIYQNEAERGSRRLRGDWERLVEGAYQQALVDPGPYEPPWARRQYALRHGRIVVVD